MYNKMKIKDTVKDTADFEKNRKLGNGLSKPFPSL